MSRCTTSLQADRRNRSAAGSLFMLTVTRLAHMSTSTRSSPSTKLYDSSAVALRRSTFGENLELPRGLSFCRYFHSHVFARLGLAIQFLRFRRRSAHIAQAQHFDFKLATVISNAQHISDANLARRLRNLPIRMDPAQVARVLRQRSSLEESCRPQPRIHPYVGHEQYCATARGVITTEGTGKHSFCPGVRR